MNDSGRLRGIELRYVLTLTLHLHGPATVKTLNETLAYQGFAIAGRPSKSVSGALRWEIERGRVFRLARGRYGPSKLPRSTEYRIHKRVLALRALAGGLSRSDAHVDGRFRTPVG